MKHGKETKEPRNKIEIMDKQMDGKTDTRSRSIHCNVRPENVHKKRQGRRNYRRNH